MKLKTICLIATLIASGNSIAAVTMYDDVVVSEIALGSAYNGDVVIRLNTYNSEERPSCATDYWGLRFDATTEVGKQMLSMAMLAWSTGNKVAIAGQGTCFSGTGSETLRWIRGQ